jgi:hypothetical protein
MCLMSPVRNLRKPGDVGATTAARLRLLVAPGGYFQSVNGGTESRRRVSPPQQLAAASAPARMAHEYWTS